VLSSINPVIEEEPEGYEFGNQQSVAPGSTSGEDISAVQAALELLDGLQVFGRCYEAKSGDPLDSAALKTKARIGLPLRVGPTASGPGKATSVFQGRHQTLCPARSNASRTGQPFGDIHPISAWAHSQRSNPIDCWFCAPVFSVFWLLEYGRRTQTGGRRFRDLFSRPQETVPLRARLASRRFLSSTGEEV